MHQADQAIQSFDPSQPYTPAELLPIAQHVIAKLEEYIAAPIRYPGTLEDSVGPQIGFHFTSEACGSLRFFTRGFITSCIDGNRLQICATLFLYCVKQRLQTTDGKSFLDLEYRVSDSGVGNWAINDWFKDEYGEYEAYDDPEIVE